jgi:integrase/recombinase XerC
MDKNTLTIRNCVEQYLLDLSLARSANTTRTYSNAVHFFLDVLKNEDIDPDKTSIQDLSEDGISILTSALKGFSPTTERLYLTAVAGFYEYLCANKLCEINLPRVRLLIRQRARRPGIRLPQFPKDEIERVLEYAEKLSSKSSDDAHQHLRDLRDRAFILTLADTGLRVHEACNLRRGDVDWNEGQAVIIGKGDRQAIVRFSRRSQGALKDYLGARAMLDGSCGKPLTSLPLFARHDKGSGKKIKPITTATGRNIVELRVMEAIGEQAGHITPHSFRHYFVTRVLQSSGNLKLAQELARHKNISVTQRYAHLSDKELDEGYWNVFEDK